MQRQIEAHSHSPILRTTWIEGPPLVDLARIHLMIVTWVRKGNQQLGTIVLAFLNSPCLAARDVQSPWSAIPEAWTHCLQEAGVSPQLPNTPDFVLSQPHMRPPFSPFSRFPFFFSPLVVPRARSSQHACTAIRLSHYPLRESRAAPYGTGLISKYFRSRARCVYKDWMVIAPRPPITKSQLGLLHIDHQGQGTDG